MTPAKKQSPFFPSLMDELFRFDAARPGFNAAVVPPVNIRETETAFVVELSAPGQQKSDFNIEVDNDLLTISSKSSNEQTTTEGKYTRREFSFSSFQRSFTLPDSVNEDQINAAYENGILSITLPKKDEALPKSKRLIEIG